MRTIRIAAIKTREADGSIPVFWRLDEAPWSGCIHVKVENNVNDRAVIAELCALHHLAKVRRVIGDCVGFPAGTTVLVTAGAIRKLWRQDTEKGTLVPFGRFLYLTMNSAKLEVSKDIGWVDTLELRHEDQIEASPTHFQSVPIEKDGLKIRVSRHALERHQERIGTTTPTNAYHALCRLLIQENTVRVKSKDQRTARAVTKYGKKATMLVHGPSKITMVLVPESDGSHTMVTVYQPDSGVHTVPVYAGGRIEYRPREKRAATA